MTVIDLLLLIIRWCHALGAVAWVGGGIFYLLVLRPAFRRAAPPPEVNRSIGEEFRGLVNTAIIVLVVTGVILTASRLTADTVTVAYMAVLALKIGLALYMFAVIRFSRRRGVGSADRGEPERGGRLRAAWTGPTALLAIGVAIFGLADLLGVLFESGLAEGHSETLGDGF